MNKEFKQKRKIFSMDSCIYTPQGEKTLQTIYNEWLMYTANQQKIGKLLIGLLTTFSQQAEKE